MQKSINPGDYSFDQAYAALVESHRRSVDRATLIKRASAEMVEFVSRPAKEGHSLIHLLAMGAADRYGPNRNGDAFYKLARSLKLVDPDWVSTHVANGDKHTKSADTFANNTVTGLKDDCQTFTTHGKVYEHHKNQPDKGDPICGEILKSAYNDKMDRVELLIEVPDKQWSDDLQKLASDQLVPFSMSCIIDPNLPVLTSRGYLPISGVKVGDLVLTKRREWQPVTKAVKRKYSGRVVWISLRDSHYRLGLTADHPVMSSKPVQPAVAAAESGSPVDKPPKPDWICAGQVGKGDQMYGVLPIGVPDFVPIDNERLAALLGWALGCNISKTNHDLTNDDVDIVNVLGLHYGQWDFMMGVYPGLFNSSEEVRRAFLAGFLDASPMVIGSTITTVTVTDLLVLTSIRDLFRSLSIPATTRVVQVAAPSNGKARKKKKNGGLVPQLCVPTYMLNHMIPYSLVLQSPELGAGLKAADQHTADYLSTLYIPTNVDNVDFDEVSNATVYNLEVAGTDNSYLAGGYIVHNCHVPYDICSYCGHKSKKRSEYCDHLTKNIGDMTKEGHLISAVNDKAVFFDISKVRRPADRIAYGLKKAASHSHVNEESAIESRELPAELKFLDTADGEKVRRRVALMNKLSSIHKRLEVMGVKKVGPVELSRHMGDLENLHKAGSTPAKIAQFLTAMANENCLLRPDEFVAMTRGAGHHKLAEQVLNMGSLWEYMDKKSEAHAVRVAADTTWDPDRWYPGNALAMSKFASNFTQSHKMEYHVVRRNASAWALAKNAGMQKQAVVQSSEFENTVDSYAAYVLGFLDDVTYREPSSATETIESVALLT
jgi:hypothetical protein